MWFFFELCWKPFTFHSKAHLFCYLGFILCSLQSCVFDILDEVRKIGDIERVSPGIPLVYSDLDALHFFKGMDPGYFKVSGTEMAIRSKMNISTESVHPYDLNVGPSATSEKIDYKLKYSLVAKNVIAIKGTYIGQEVDTTEVLIPTDILFPIVKRDMNEPDSLRGFSGSFRVKIENPYDQVEGTVTVEFLSLTKKTAAGKKAEKIQIPLKVGVSTTQGDLTFEKSTVTFDKSTLSVQLKVRIISALSFQGQSNMQDLPLKIQIRRNFVVLDKIYGKLKPKTFDFPKRYTFDFTPLKTSIAKIQNTFDLDFANPYIDLDMETTYGIGNEVNLKKIQVYNKGSVSAISGKDASLPFTLSLPNTFENLIAREVRVDIKNSNAVQLLSTLPDSVVFTLQANLTPSANNGERESYSSDQILRGAMEVVFPFKAFWRKVDYIRKFPYQPITDENIFRDYEIDAPKLFIDATNGIPVPIRLTMILLDDKNNELFKIIDNQMIVPALIDDQRSRATASGVSSFVRKLSKTEMETYRKATQIRVLSTMAQATGTDPVFLDASQKAIIDVKASFLLKSVKI